jgi:hypothetical protein
MRVAMQYKLATDARTLRVRRHSSARKGEMLVKNVGILALCGKAYGIDEARI